MAGLTAAASLQKKGHLFHGGSGLAYGVLQLDLRLTDCFPVNGAKLLHNPFRKTIMKQAM